MANSKNSQTVLIAKAKAAFNKEDYSTTYKLCTELMQNKTASIVVYMHCISSLKLRQKSRNQVTPLINDTLLLTVALDNFYKQSGKKNANIVNYITEILFTLITTTIESVQKHYPLDRGRRSFKHAVSDAQEAMNDIKIMCNYRLSGFTAELPQKMNAFINETGDKLMAYVSNWVNIVRDPTNNWLYEDDTNDLYERIVAYHAQIDEMNKEKPEEEITAEEEAKAFVASVVEKTQADKSAESETILNNDAKKNVSITEDQEINEHPQEIIEEPIDTVLSEDRSDHQPIEAPSTRASRKSTKSSFLKPIDIVIGVLVLLFVIVVSIIIIYLIQPSLILSLIGQ